MRFGVWGLGVRLRGATDAADGGGGGGGGEKFDGESPRAALRFAPAARTILDTVSFVLDK